MKKIWSALIVVVVVFIIYAPALRNGFVWDDTALVLRDPLIRSWQLIPEGFNHFLFVDATASDFYRPVQRMVYTFDYAFFAFQPGPYHFTSIFWHAAAAVALLFLAQELLGAFAVDPGKARLIAIISALVWAVHPVQSAAVIYVAGLADPLAATFGFLGLYLLCRAANRQGAAQLILLIGAGLALLLSALSKESGLIFLVLGLVWFLLQKNRRLVWKTAALSAFVCAIYFTWRAGAEHNPPPEFSPPPPALVRPIIAARAVAEYAGLVLFPRNLHMDRDVESRPTGFNEASLARSAWRELQTLLGVILIAAFAFWMVRARQRAQPVFVCLLFALISYLPISGVVAWNASVAEHWIYLPSAFLFLGLALQLSDLLEKRPSSTSLAALSLLALWILFLSGRTFLRTFDWKDQRTFFERTIASGGDSARMLINLGSLELNENKLEDAAVHLHAALQKKPDQPLAIINLAAVALKQKDFKLARQLLTRATQMPLVDAQAHELLAILENKESGKVDVMRMRLASRTGPPNWSIEKRYISLLEQTAGPAAAINELLGVLQQQWYRAESWKLLSDLHAKFGHSTQAAQALAQARAYDVHLSDPESTSSSTNGSKKSPAAEKSTSTESSAETEASPSPGGEQE